jgi:hypothetical protein
MLTAPRKSNAAGWQERRGTLDDQAIFGPVREFVCACGKYRGSKHQGMICDRCGVKVTALAARRQRFGHIELPAPIVHPFSDLNEPISAIPVLPAAFVESSGGEGLAVLYDEMVRVTDSASTTKLTDSFNRLASLLLAPASMAFAWSLQDADLLIFGMALSPRDRNAPLICNKCGYPLEGLDVQVCPGCGHPKS